MATRPERRHVARLTVPAGVRARALALQTVRLLDLSPQGARIEHPDRLHVGLLCLVDLPPALGRGSLTGRIVWTKLQRTEQTVEGTRQRAYRSGLTWTGLSPEQQGTLAAALESLKAAQEGLPPKGSAGSPREAARASDEKANGQPEGG